MTLDAAASVDEEGGFACAGRVDTMYGGSLSGGGRCWQWRGVVQKAAVLWRNMWTVVNGGESRGDFVGVVWKTSVCWATKRGRCSTWNIARFELLGSRFEGRGLFHVEHSGTPLAPMRDQEDAIG